MIFSENERGYMDFIDVSIFFYIIVNHNRV